MSRFFLFLAVVLAAAIAGPTRAEGPINLQETAKSIREGKIDVGKVYSLDEKKGRFHNIHSDAIGTDCATCHFGDRYRDDVMLLRKFELLRKRAQGQVDRSACLGCHQQGGVASAWYGGRAGVKAK